ncbi:hypothetical protein I306_00513 [Cryptococcus gattii EJB2]|uniref:Protein regulator of cytokinesis 1 n=1 Tax=Cryptococcus gattii EJB2 TaxID=1296103 RepID=A0ABR5C3E5_9TREE|nr:hypothetical protein I306_00513 [Cryptococcus gattii EJB2]
MSAYLDEQTPHLRHLHAQLSLPPAALEQDLHRIEAAIKAVITSIIREREAQVDQLKDDIAATKSDLATLQRAVGDRRDREREREREEEEETLPRQLERLNDQAVELKKMYDERLVHIKQQQSTLDRLSTILGPPWQPMKQLEVIASSSRSRASSSSGMGVNANPPFGLDGKRSLSSSTQTIAQAIALGHAHGQTHTQSQAQDKNNGEWYDVRESVVEEIDEAVKLALAERDARRRTLCQSLFTLTWLHSELALPPIPTSSPHNFPAHLLPLYSEEEQPGLYASYERLLHTIITLNPLPPMDDGNEEWPVVDDLEGFENTEPEIALIEWVEETMELWTSEKEEHEARIQELYNLVEPLWTKLGIEQETMDCFVEMNRGSGEATIKAYEAEYERLLELRRASLSSFILSTRSTIVALQTSLLMSPRSQSASFPAMHDEEYTEDLLHMHEKEIERLEEEVESKKNILPKVREWFKLVEDEEELERNEKDPNRFSRRGGAMLREEKLRKRVNGLKPKIEMDLLSLLPTWEEENGRPFIVSGRRVVDRIHDAMEEKELVKEAKKVSLFFHMCRAKQGLLPLHPAAGPSRTLAPSKTIRATPSHASSSSSRSTRLTAATGGGTGNLYSKSSTALSSTSAAIGTGTGTGTTRLGKRPIGALASASSSATGPGPTPTVGNKRAKMAGVGLGLGTAGGGGTAGTGGLGVGRGGRSVSSRSAVTGVGGSPTPRHQRDFENYSQGQQRSVSYSSGIPSHSAAYPPSHTRLPTTTTTTTTGGVKALAPAPKRGYNPLGGEGEVRRAPRKSFKPRSSMAPVGGTGIVNGVNSNGNGNGGLGLGIEGLGGWREGLEGNDDGLEVDDDDDVF